MEEQTNAPITVSVSNLSIKFNLGKEKGSSFKDAFINIFTSGKRRQEDEFVALSDVSFQLHEGDRVGILGLNGAGKSTLLKAVAGVFKPTEGTVRRKGMIAPLLELGAGFEQEYTARENIYLYGSVLGYTKEYIEERFDDIIQFAELEKFVDVPIKNYSSGMRSRLGFAICTAVEPDILILDEVLSVGDAKFRKKSEERIFRLFSEDVTVLFVSHSLEQVKRICNLAMILDHGKLLAFGDIDEVASIYEEMITSNTSTKNIMTKAQKRRINIQRKGRFMDGWLLMKNQKLSLDEVLDIMEIPEDLKDIYKEGIAEYGEKRKGIDE